MNAQEHRDETERLLDESRSLTDGEIVALTIQTALVHALLAISQDLNAIRSNRRT